MTQQVMVLLDCKHTRRVHPKQLPDVGDLMICRFDGERPVTHVFTHEWHARCQECKYSRWAGQDKGKASRQANYHRKWEHEVTVSYDKVGEKPVKKIAATAPLDRKTAMLGGPPRPGDQPPPF